MVGPTLKRALSAIIAALAVSAAGAEEKKPGTFGVGLRYRYENVSDDAFEKDAHASTLRTNVLFESAKYRRFFAVLEFENTADLGLGDQHDSTANGITDRPVVADPTGTEVHQVYLGFEGIPGIRLLAGRQEIVFDDARFVGNVSWRQNFQSFDGARVTARSIPRTVLDYAWVRNVNTVFGTNRDSDHHLLQAEIDLGRCGKALAYFYRLDFGPFAASSSSATFGARWAGSIRTEPVEIPLRFEAARQEAAAGNPGPLEADYFRAVVGVRRGGWKADLGWERLGGSPDEGRFQTPLATLHKFNGWADKFLSTPGNGLEDLFASVTYGAGPWSGEIAVHRFEADAGGATYGSEFDGLLAYRARWGQEFALKLALYDADAFSTDTEKLWIQTTYRF